MARVTPVSEIFRACSTLDRSTQIAYLRNTQSEPMRWMVQGAFHPNVKWLIPPGEPPYQPAPQRENEGFLHVVLSPLRRLDFPWLTGRVVS